MDDLVVGAGLTGLTTALLLARAGRRVAVIEARQVGAVTTGNTTGKLSLLQGTKLSRMLGLQSKAVVEAYVEANLEGQQWLLRFCGDHGVPVQTRDAVTYASAESEVAAARDEHDAAADCGPRRAVDGQARRPVSLPWRHGAARSGPVRPDGRARRARQPGARSRRNAARGSTRRGASPSTAGRVQRSTMDRPSTRRRRSGDRHADARSRALLREGRATALVRARLRLRTTLPTACSCPPAPPCARSATHRRPSAAGD